MINVVNSSKIELPTGKMYFSDLRGHRSVARPSCAIQVLERMNRVPGNIIPVTSDWFGTQTVPWEHNPSARPHRCYGNDTTAQ